MGGYSSGNKLINECQKMVVMVTFDGCHSNCWCQFSLNLYTTNASFYKLKGVRSHDITT